MINTSLARHLTLLVFTLSFLIAPAKAGNFGEHKYIGDAAFKKYCAANPWFASLLKELLGSSPLDISSPYIPLKNNNAHQLYKRDMYAGQYPLLILNGKAITYGDLTALSGDHSPDFIESYRRFFNDATFNASGLFNNLFDDVLNQFDKELKNLDNGGTGYNPVFIEFISLAARDRSHFHIPATPLRQEIDLIGQRTYDYAMNLLYSGVEGQSFADKNRDKILAYFEANAVAKYSILHSIAKMYYVRAISQNNRLKTAEATVQKLAESIAKGDTSKQRQYDRAKEEAASVRKRAKTYLLLALFTNAFSEHYLQDMFAAGHFFVDRNAKDFLGLEAKGIHDFFGKRGLNTFVEGNPITLLGDGNYTDTQLVLATEANLTSLKDIFDQDKVDVNDPRKPENDYLRFLQTPTAEPTQLFPAFKKIPDVPLGKNYISQRKNIGRSLSGMYYGLYGLGSSKSYGGGITAGFNYLVATPRKPDSPIESKFAFGLNSFLEASSDKQVNDERKWQGRFGLGANFLFFDWVYANATINSSLPVLVGCRFEEGIQIKPLPWKYGIRIGIVQYTAGITPSPSFTVGLIRF